MNRRQRTYVYKRHNKYSWTLGEKHYEQPPEKESGKSQKTVAMLLPIWSLLKGNKCSKYIQANLEGKPQWPGIHRASLILLWSCIQWTDKAASG